MFGIKKILNNLNKKQYKVDIDRLDTNSDSDGLEVGIKKVMNLLNYTKTSSTSYSAGKFDSGYHSFKIGDYDFKGQRNPKIRFEKLPFVLDGLSVLDIGCNQGGMLHAFSEKLKFGVGVDFDSRMINGANKIKSYKKSTNLDFYVFDLENENLDYILDFLPEKKVDVVLLLSVCMWISNWQKVIDFSANVSDKLVFETNGKPEQQQEQIDYLRKVYKNVVLVTERSEDDPSQKLRQLYYCD